MKKKGSRPIPDFSAKRKGPSALAALARQPEPVLAPVSAPRDRVTKPHSTSAKSGRRGQ